MYRIKDWFIKNRIKEWFIKPGKPAGNPSLGRAFKRNAKLFEAIGVLLVLLCWLLQITIIQKWSNAKDKLASRYEEVRDEDRFTMIADNVRLESALTREWLRKGLSTDVPLQEVAWQLQEAAWQSDDVRQRWLAGAHAHLVAINDLNSEMEKLEVNFQLGARTLLERNKEAIEKAISALPVGITLREQPFQLPVPPLDKMSLAQANKYVANELPNAVNAVIDAYDEFVRLLETHKRREERPYNFWFGVGSILIFIGKLAEWWRERESHPAGRQDELRPL